MNLKVNINKIHGDLLNQFNNVKIEEKSNLKFGNYFLLTINEDKELKMILTKKEVENNIFNWAYYSNPLNENSDLVERKSTIETFKNDVKDIFEKNRFSSDYLENI